MKRKLRDVSAEDFSRQQLESGIDADGDVGDDHENCGDAREHKMSMQNLAENDPEFFQFLKENDENLLNFNEESSDESDGDEDDETIHVPPSKLLVASDDSGDETEDDGGKIESSRKKRTKITTRMLDQWCNQLKEPKPILAVFDVMNAFKIVVEQVAGEEESRVHDSMAFNGVLRLCLLDLIPTVNRILRVSASDALFKPTLSKMWSKIQIQMKSYLNSMTKILSFLSEPDLVKSVLKHISQLIPYYSVFPKITKTLLKKLVRLWASAEESIRVLSFFSIWRIARAIPNDVLQPVIKDMYLTYVKNCKFTSPTTWHLINFMRKSLVDILSLNETILYQNAFVYIRQLAIHLRNALAVKKKDSMKPVYNWQFVHCLYLWSEVVSSQHTSPTMQSLVYPLVQVIIGTIKLVPTAKYVPLRFHCIRAVLTIAKDTKTTIPMLPLITEVLKFVNVGKKHQKLNWKKLDLSCALKLSKSQLYDNAFKNALMETSYELLLLFLDTQSHTVAFPELILPTVVYLKNFLKDCNVQTYNKQLKQLVEKLEENAKFIEHKRNSIAFSLSDSDAVIEWETATKQEKTPLSTYYQQYSRVKEREKSQQLKNAQFEQNAPSTKKTVESKSNKEERTTLDREEFNELFAQSDSDDELPFIVTKKKKIKSF